MSNNIKDQKYMIEREMIELREDCAHQKKLLFEKLTKAKNAVRKPFFKWLGIFGITVGVGIAFMGLSLLVGHTIPVSISIGVIATAVQIMVGIPQRLAKSFKCDDYWSKYVDYKMAKKEYKDFNKSFQSEVYALQEKWIALHTEEYTGHVSINTPTKQNNADTSFEQHHNTKNDDEKTL